VHGNEYNVVLRKSKAKRPLGRRRGRWEDNTVIRTGWPKHGLEGNNVTSIKNK
jgi:hypothetical protein